MVKKKKNRKKKKSSSVVSMKNNWRFKALFVIFAFVGLGLIAKLYHLQIVKGDYYSALARGQKIDILSESERGQVYFQDNAGDSRFLAATNKELYLLYADPKELDDEKETLEKIKLVTEIDPEQEDIILERMKNKNSSYAFITRELEDKEIERIKQLNLEGVYTRAEPSRFYPAGPIAAHTLGFLGFQGGGRAGQYGVEEYYNDYLSGSSSDTSLLGGLFFKDEEISVDLELTIDYGVQFAVEKKLEELVKSLEAEKASAIFMNPKTGEIIAMANFPDFDPNIYNEVENISVFSNHSIQSVYELGSIFKPITMAAAIDGGAITPQTVYTDTGAIVIGGYTIRNSDGQAHKEQTMTEVLEKSLNTGVIYAQEKLGKKKFKEYLEDFELDEVTGIDLPGEVPGNIENVKNTNSDINYATASFGQGISFSPIRFLSSISAIANNGNIMRPHIIKKTIKEDDVIETKPEVVAQPISEMTASRVTAMMVSVVENGFGSKAAVPGYTVAGKTGTAQVPNEDGPGYSDKTIHSFVGFAPAYNPKFIGIIKVDNPKGIRFSSDSVAPAFGELASFILQYYKIPPQ